MSYIVNYYTVLFKITYRIDLLFSQLSPSFYVIIVLNMYNLLQTISIMILERTLSSNAKKLLILDKIFVYFTMNVSSTAKLLKIMSKKSMKS